MMEGDFLTKALQLKSHGFLFLIDSRLSRALLQYTMIRLLCCLVVVPWLTTAFPILPQSKTQLTLLRATPTKETLTEVEEEILFGDDTAISDHRRSTDVFGNVLNNNHNKNNNPQQPQQRPDPVVAKLQTIRESISSCPALWSALAQVVPEYRAVFDERLTEPAVDYNFQQMAVQVQKSAAVFSQLGIRKHDKVAFFS